MPQFSILNEMPASSTVANLFAGSAFEFIGRTSRVIIAATIEVGGVSNVTATIQYGPEVQLEEGVINVEALAGRGPSWSDDVIVDDIAAAGDRLVFRVTNAFAGIIDIRAKVRIIAIG